jgi:hypothetical protein
MTTTMAIKDVAVAAGTTIQLARLQSAQKGPLTLECACWTVAEGAEAAIQHTIAGMTIS